MWFLRWRVDISLSTCCNCQGNLSIMTLIKSKTKTQEQTAAKQHKQSPFCNACLLPWRLQQWKVTDNWQSRFLRRQTDSQSVLFICLHVSWTWWPTAWCPSFLQEKHYIISTTENLLIAILVKNTPHRLLGSMSMFFQWGVSNLKELWTE